MEVNIKLNLLIGVTGSVAAIRLFQIIEEFSKLNKFNIKIIITASGLLFTDEVIPNYSEVESKFNCKIYTDADEVKEYKEHKKVLHIELRKWADLLLWAPLSANTLAKITNGWCDNLLTCVLRAWDFNKKGFFCLAMNTLMYEHFLTKKQINIWTNEFGFIQIPSKITKLKCGDVGIGGIADTKDIIKIVLENLQISDK